MLAPVVLFVYNRPDHTRHSISMLENNYLSDECALYIYSDAPACREDVNKVNEVRNLIHNVDGFSAITVIERKKNVGLASNIVDGVTDIVNEHGKIIVIEDDIVTSPYFISYMNDALNFYLNSAKVMHISGWNYPINPQGLPDTFLWRVMNCWGWATWADRWQHYNRDLEGTVNSFSKSDIHCFDLEGAYNFWNQIISNRDNKINTWAIFWYATIFKKKGLCLNPARSLTKNIGLDGTGMHCGSGVYSGQSLYEKKLTFFPDDIKENVDAVEAVKTYLNSCKKPLWKRVVNRIRKHIL